jgi:molecular chaperone GrpE
MRVNDEQNNKKDTANQAQTDDVEFVSDDIDAVDDESEEGATPADLIKKLRVKLKKAVDEKQEYLNGWQKERAAIANLRKRDEEDKKEFLKFAKSEIVSDLLPILDSFERAQSNKDAWEKVDKNWRIGVEYIYSQLKQALESHGLKEVSPLGLTFDPVRDEALEYVPVDDKAQDHKIIEVTQKGYTIGDKQIRAPKVKVGEVKKA